MRVTARCSKGARAAFAGTHARALSRLCVSLAVALAILAATAGSSHAAAGLSWSTPRSFDEGGTPTGLSCASEGLCVAVDAGGSAFVSANPTSPVAQWSKQRIDTEHALSAVSCLASGLCLAGDRSGRVSASTDPLAGTSSWSTATTISSSAITAVSCASTSLCAATNSSGEVLVSTDPAAATPQWRATALEVHGALSGISCVESLCAAVSDSGDVAVTTQPAGGSWRVLAIDPSPPTTAVSCTPNGSCLAVDEAGQVLASADPAGASPTWTVTPLSLVGALTGASCTPAGLCVAVSARGEALTSDQVTSTTSAWGASLSATGIALAGISCLPGGACVAVDSSGRTIVGLDPPPAANDASAGDIASTEATLAGTVAADDASPLTCLFEYGPTSSYGGSVPCSATPAPNGGSTTVAARVGGLTPNTTYHFRLLASTPRGTQATADASFTTLVSSAIALVHPHPSISGTPAVGQKLTCQSGVSSTSGAKLAYSWIRDLIPIAEASSSTYTPRGVDSGGHLQCKVTATNGGGSASATSSFVTIPPSQPLVSSGETAVGRASWASGRLRVPVLCSPKAEGSCSLAMRATSQANAATLAHTSARLSPGQHQTLSMALASSARKLLAKRRRIPTTLTVTGTVIGVIRAALSSQTVVLESSGRRAKGASLDPSAGAAGAEAELPPPPPPPARSARAPGPRARASVLAATPYMGWDTYFALGGKYSESTILMQASRLLSLGLARQGYRYVWLDVGWWQGARNSSGTIAVSHNQWPHGLRWLTNTLHAAGLRVGLYTDAGRNGCGGSGQGSYGHYQQDADTFASWGFDAVKVDFCGGAELHLNPVTAYSQFHEAILAAHRPMLLDICNFLQPGQYAEGQPTLAESVFSSYSYGPGVATSWRTDTDVGAPGQVSFEAVLRNMDADAADPGAAGPGHWNDPDYLGPGQGLSATQFRSQFSMWSMLAAPLMISDNLTKISSASLATVSRAAVVAIDQDHAGIQGRLISTAGSGQAWAKPLADGSVAVALLNRGHKTLEIATNARAVGLPSVPHYSIQNLWTGATRSSTGALAASVPAQATVLLRVGIE
jgi:Alpha galactosidase A/Alpha galactosidase C-terminal beta sandwich domain